MTDTWTDTVVAGFASDKPYVVETYTKVIERCLLMTTDPGDLVLDPTCGSGTTAYVAEQWGRRWITIDTSRVALALARTRLMAAKYPYFLLADSPEGQRKEMELTGKVTATGPLASPKPAGRPSGEGGNPEPRIPNPGFRVPSRRCPPRLRLQMILDNLRKAGVQNTRKQERLAFDRFEPYAGTWVHARGEYVDADKKLKRVAVSIGPERGTVGPLHIREAAKEAVQGLGHDLLIVCGFAFDPHVTEEAKRYGDLTVLVTRMNPDLAMGDDLLKKTGAGNLFMVFGEPDIEIQPVGAEGLLQVELKGLDIYDPTTGAVRSSSTDDVACWFVDTDYNGESFFVRHAYFTGADEPYEKLKRALRAEIDEAAWSTLYATVSRPFAPPSTGKIAVKVINHYGDEVLKVFGV